MHNNHIAAFLHTKIEAMIANERRECRNEFRYCSQKKLISKNSEFVM